MLNIDRFGWEAIGRFIEPQVIEISSLGNLIQIDGKNNNTGGSSASAKSTIFHAWDYLLGFNKIPAGKLQSRLTKNGIAVWAEGTLDGKPIKISRSKAKGLVIEGAGHDVSGNSKLAEETLDKILAMPRELARKICHKRQKEGGFFLDFGPKETNDFLMDCLNLNELKAKAAKIEEKLKALIKEKEAVDKSLLSNREGLIATQNAVKGLGEPPVQDIHPEVVEKLKAALNISEVNLTGVLGAHKTELAELNKTRPQVSVTAFNRADLDNYEKQLREIRDAITKVGLAEVERVNKAKQDLAALNLRKSKLQHVIVTGLALKKDAENIAAQIKKIRESVCPTCAQVWNTGKSHEENLIEQLKKIKPQIEAGRASEIELLNEVDPAINEMLQTAIQRPINVDAERAQESNLLAYVNSEKEKEKAHNLAENSRIKAISDQFSQKSLELGHKHQREADLARGQVDLDRRTYDAANLKLQTFKAAKARYEQSSIDLKAQEAKYAAEVARLEASAADLAMKILMTEEGKRALKIFISCSFDDALETISKEATRIIRHIPNMANATIQLEGQRETGKGAVKEEVTAVIHVDGEEGVPIETLSGGERSALDLAIDLAVIDLIESVSGKGMNFFILDEPFTGLGPVEIEMALEVLKNSNSNKKLIIVDHHSEVKQMVHNSIVVERTGAISTLAE